MQLSILFSHKELPKVVEFAEEYLGSKLRVDKTDLSLFEQYRLYPGEHKFIPKLYMYRIVCKSGQYHFGMV